MRVTIKVLDTGVGIPKSERTAISKTFSNFKTKKVTDVRGWDLAWLSRGASLRIECKAKTQLDSRLLRTVCGFSAKSGTLFEPS